MEVEIDIDFFEKLMPTRVKKVLLVASLYDSFLFADDEMLNEIFSEHLITYREHFNIHRVVNQKEAYERIKNENYDLVIMMTQTSDYNMKDFVDELKMKKIPVVILSFSMQDIYSLDENIKNSVDGVFLWQGDTKIFASIINLIEDKLNLEHDLEMGVQCILLVEDNIRFCSVYLPIIYSELIKQMQLVMADELNLSRRILRMQARPKIFLAKNYEEAWNIFEKYSDRLLGVITDIEYPKQEKSDEKAGLLLTRRIKEKYFDMPVLIQSYNSEYEKIAVEMDASFINKNAVDLTKKLRDFIRRYFGFGDFIFDDGSGNEIARASDLSSMLKVLRVVPVNSIIYHASRNHFSKWFFARTEFEIGYKIRPKKISEFKDGEEIREYLIETIHQFLYKTQLGSILKFDRNKYNVNTPFAKIGYGSIGGKARGIAFIDYLLAKKILKDKYFGINVKTPNSVVVSTDVFDFFIEQNNLRDFINEGYSDRKLAEIFENIHLPTYALRDIAAVLDKLKGPLALRSSSLLEDSKTYPFAGIYKTYMYNNVSGGTNDLHAVEKIIKYIYASTFSEEAREYRRLNPHMPDEEKMAVIIQSVIGREYLKNYYFPLISGVLQSYNFYSVAPLKPEEPVVSMALGLGEAVVGGRYFVRYSPAHPENIHQFSTVEDTLRNYQKKFFAVNLGKINFNNLNYDNAGCTELVDLDESGIDKKFPFLFSYYIHSEERIVESYADFSIPVLTFFPVIKNSFMPLNELFLKITEVCKQAMGSNFEMEFAVDYNPETSDINFYILQIRYLLSRAATRKVDMNLNKKDIIVYCKNIVGNAYIDNVSDFVFVKQDNFSNLKTQQIAREISDINEMFKKENGHYILIGPGRWGSSDIHLGIPVKWNNISMVKTIVEAGYGNFKVDPSYGTHFFHNIVALSIPYFSIVNKEDYINWDVLNRGTVIYETENVRWVRINKKVEVLNNQNEGFILVEK